MPLPPGYDPEIELALDARSTPLEQRSFCLLRLHYAVHGSTGLDEKGYSKQNIRENKTSPQNALLVVPTSKSCAKQRTAHRMMGWRVVTVHLLKLITRSPERKPVA